MVELHHQGMQMATEDLMAGPLGESSCPRTVIKCMPRLKHNR